MKPKLYYLASSIIKSYILHLAIIFVITDWSVVAQTQIQSGNICGVWKKSGSPYLINGHITVLDDSVLTIEPGVVVEFQGHYKLVVYGQILAVGTKFDSITFTVKNKTEGWKGIRFDNSDYGAAGAMKDNHLSKLYYCKIQYGNATDEVPDYRGGAIYIYNFAQLVISNCNISYNKAKYGGGIAVYSTRGRVQIVKNIISYNTAEYDGGGVFISGSEGYLTDNLIYKNTSNYGGGIQCIAANPFITNTTVCNNTATQGGGMDCFRSSPIVRNSLFWGNTAKLGAQVYLYDEDADPDFYYCNIQGGRDAFGRHYATYTGIYDTCLDADPLFNDTLNGDYSFRSGSPCIDKGDPNYEPGTKALDIRGNPRIDQIIDLGAIEYINNYPPTDIQLSKNSVNEKLPVGTIIGLFTATDKDVGDSHIFTFATGNGVNDADNDRFTISNNQLLTDTLFSLPADSVFNINIRVNDSRGGWYNEAFQITVKNINATPSNIILSANTLSESRSVGSMVGILSVVDSDPSDLHTYKLINSAGNSFIIDGNRVVTNKQFNYALQNTYTIEVEVNDGNSGIFKKQFVIKITEQSIYFSLDSTWEWRNPMPFVGGLYSIIQQSTNRLIAGGEYGIMLNSDTSGLIWNQSDNLSNLTLKINDIAFFDNTNQKGYAINSSGLLATNDGGLTWSSDNSVAQLVSLTGTLDYKAVSFYQDKLYVLVNDAQKSYLFSKTSTSNWTAVQVPKGDLLLGMEYPFLWSKEIVYNGTKSVLTLDTSYDLKQVIAAGTPSDFLFLAKNQGFTYKLYKNSLTNDLGEIALSENGDLAYDAGFKPANTILKFINTDTILALGDEVYLFTDTCSKFEILTKNGVDGDASNKTIATDAVKLAHNFFITATDGKVYKLTGTKAQSLIKQSNSNVSYIQGLYFNNVAVGYLIQSHTPDNITKIYKTESYGIDWFELAKIEQSINPVGKFYVFPDDSKVAILDTIGIFTIYDIKNRKSEKLYNVSDFYFLDIDKGWYLSKDKKVYVTEDKGVTWILTCDLVEKVPEIRTKTLMNTIWFNDSEIGYAAGQDAITVKTTDGGITWNVLFTGEVVINALNFVDNTNGYAVANDGRFFQISPNWEMTQLHIDGELLVDNMHGFAMLDEKNGFIAIESGIITTVDAGKTFTRKPIPTGLVLGAWQKTPGAFVFDGSMKRFIFGKQQVMLTSRDFDNTSQLFSILPRGNDFYTTLGANLYLTFPNTLKGNVSKTLAYTIEINNLTNGLKILAPTHFEVSKDGVTFSSSLDYTKSDARGKQKLTLYARFRPTAFAPPSYDGKPASRAFHGYIIHKSLGAMTIKIPVKGKEGEYFAVAPNAIKEITEKPDFKLYPNPNKGEFRIKLENINRINGVLTIYDFTGRRVALPLINNSNEIEIDANYLPSGVYFVEYKTNDYKIVRKMVRN